MYVSCIFLWCVGSLNTPIIELGRMPCVEEVTPRKTLGAALEGSKMGSSMCSGSGPQKLEASVEDYDGDGWLFPMYVVKVYDFLKMKGVPEPHHVLKQEGLLHTWQPGMFTIFVSHQWLGREHADPAGGGDQIWHLPK